MTQHLEHARKAMTAIAAVLALSSTPLLAQETASPPPVSDPAPTPTPPAADPLAAEPAPAEPTATETTAAPAKPKTATTARRTTRTATRTSTRSATSSAPATPAAEPVAPATAPAPADTLAAAPVAPGPMPVAQPEAVPADETQSGFAELDPDAALPIAGAGALGLILLGGAAAVRRRKRRKQEQADEAAKWDFIQSHAEEEPPQQAAEPAFARAASPRHDPVPGKTPIVGAPTTRLPEGFDLSRFGPHVQAAYRGPTTDNPSLSLRYRLRRASFLDQQELRAMETASAKPQDIPANGSWKSRSDADFMFRRAARPADKPALQN